MQADPPPATALASAASSPASGLATTTPEVIESALENMSWSMYKPVSTATRMLPNPDSNAGLFNRTIYKPFSEEELAAALFEGGISIGLSPDFRFPHWKVRVGAPGETTTFGGLLTAIDRALDTPADDEMKQGLRDLGAMAVMKRGFQNRTAMTGPSPPAGETGPIFFETWDGDERSITARHCVGNTLCAYFEGVAYDSDMDVFRIRIGT